MTQNAIVTKIADNNTAEVKVIRQSACGGNCSSCESCMYQTEITVNANNCIAAKAGDRVIIESQTSIVLCAAFIVCIVPVILLLLFYFLGSVFGLSQTICMIFAFAGLFAGFALLPVFKRFIPFSKIKYDIISITNG